MTELENIKARLKAAQEGWCQLMPEGYATKETGPKRCQCGAVGFPYEHRPFIDPDVARLISALELAINALAWIEQKQCDECRSYEDAYDARKEITKILSQGAGRE